MGLKRRLFAGTINHVPAEEGWENVHLDISSRLILNQAVGMVRPDVVCSLVDVADQGLDPFDEIRCSQVLEHLIRHETDPALAALFAVLVPGGRLDIDVPDFDRICRAWIAGDYPPEDLLQLTYGDPSPMPDDHFNAHRHGFSESSLRAHLSRTGFTEIRRIDDPYGSLILRLEARRP